MGYGSQGTKKDRANGKSVQDKAPRFNDVQFVNYELDKQTQAQCKAWEMDEAGVFDAIHKETGNGYTFSLKWDSYSQSYACFMQQKTENGANSGFILTGRGSSPFKA